MLSMFYIYQGINLPIIPVGCGQFNSNSNSLFEKKPIPIYWILPYHDFKQFFPSFLHYTGNAIQAFGNGTDVGVWQPQPPIMSTPPDPYTPQRGRDRTSNALEDPALTNDLDSNADHLYSFCGSLQVLKAISILQYINSKRQTEGNSVKCTS